MPAASTRPAVDAGLLEQLVGEAGGEVERLVARRVDVDLRLALGEDGERQVGDGDAHVAVAEVDAEERAGGLVERDEHRRPPALGAARRRRDLALDDQALGLQVGDEARDGRAAQTGLARDVGTADRPALAEGVDHAQAVALAQ